MANTNNDLCSAAQKRTLIVHFSRPIRSERWLTVYTKHILGSRRFLQVEGCQHGFYPSRTIAVELYFQNKMPSDGVLQVALRIEFVDGGEWNRAQVFVKCKAHIIIGVVHFAEVGLALINDVDHWLQAATVHLVKKAANIVRFTVQFR